MSGILKEAEDIVFPQLTELEQLAMIKKLVADFDIEIKNLEQIHGITLLREERAKRQKEYDTKLAAIAPTLAYKRDKFLEATKCKGDSYREGHLKMIRHSVARRTINRAEFIKAHKDLALKICSIPVGAAEKKLGEEEVTRLSNIAISYSYELVDLLQEDIP